MSQAIGSEYFRLLEDFLKLGGNLSHCPFDTEDYTYVGPHLENGEIVLFSNPIIKKI
jgi:hypothetical protein